ncbi:DNA/RNA non-specific endonuclease [Sporofaciens sp. SGI.106]|uniref:DNA/RNA non-specific endonuclease n=1 Tax=Sporofaciens sp. SGI.106 TaxID=3420568 RepID=UPI002A9D1C22|nr:DNA/RNA non-specific endonuclease [Lachnoclostridium sp.]
MKNMKRYLCILSCITAMILTVTGCSVSSLQNNSKISSFSRSEAISVEEIPEYRGEPYVVIQDNLPDFSKEDITEESFEEYSELDDLGRCGTAVANIGQDLMPTEKRGSIGQVKPTGWHTVKYDNVDGKYLYNRCHLIGYQLTAENANEENLITGTRYMNVEGMLPFENMVADYIKETDNHVLYRVTPVFEGDNLLASGVQMEALSVEDGGEGISFNVYIYNVQPGIDIDYTTGESSLADSAESTERSVGEIRGNSNSKIYHCPGQTAYEDMADSKYLVIFSSEEEAQKAGYRKAKR